MSVKKFWMVARIAPWLLNSMDTYHIQTTPLVLESGQSPRRIHQTKEDADEAAFKLAAKQPGDAFVVLEAAYVVKAHLPTPVVFSLEPPFTSFKTNIVEDATEAEGELKP